MPVFTIGNKSAEKWTEEEAGKIFELMRTNAENDNSILCLQDAIHSVKLYRSGMDYLTDKFPVFGNLKKDIQDIIISRVNKGAITGDFNPTACIWRMKQCGEKDESGINHQNNGGSFEAPVQLDKDVITKLIDKL